MRTSKRRLFSSSILVLLMVALCCQATYCALVPYGQKSELIWSEYRQQENLDAVCFGSSLSGHAFDPAIIDSMCGTSSFNMSTPTQRVSDSYIGLREVIKQHKIKRIFYGVDIFMFLDKDNLNPVRTFEYEKWKGDGLSDRFYDLAYLLQDANLLLDERSINWLFPWTESHTYDGLKGISRNLKMRLDGTSVIEAAKVNENTWHYFGQGYGNYDMVLDYNRNKFKSLAEFEKINAYPIDHREQQRLAELVDLCAENDIEFIAFVPALPDFSLVSIKDYYTGLSSDARTIVESHGGSFYDFNLAAPSFYQAEENHYEDLQHYNVEGGKAFSEALGKLVMAHEMNQDVSSWFISLDERLDNIDHISAVRAYINPFDDGRIGGRIKVQTFTGPDVQAEFRFLAKSAGDNRFKVVKDWSLESEFDFAPEKDGRYTIRVEARREGTGSDCERWSDLVVTI